MFAQIITIGDEILIGHTVDRNSAHIAAELNRIGIRVQRIVSVSDQEEAIKQALEEAVSQVDLVLLTGGLGPTRDDITKKALCACFRTPLVFNEKVFRQNEKMLAARGIGMNLLNRSQAEIPRDSIPLNNETGTAPGLWFDRGGRVVVALPGVPHEMANILNKEVIPRLTKRFKTPVVIHRTINTFGTFEARLAELLADFENTLPQHIRLAYLPSYGIIKLRLSLNGSDRTTLEKERDYYQSELEKIVGKYVWGYDSDTLEELVGKELAGRGATLSLAESCTGGAIARMITSVPGSSRYFTGSVVAYSNAAKKQWLGVDDKMLSACGAVSRPVAEQMARGAMEKFSTAYAVAVTGIAGPTGGTPAKPAGTVWIAVAGKERTISEKFLFGEGRQRVILRSANAALHLLLQLIRRYPV
ncbi:MAG: competence/damage-inducible protein A [Bacteroidales bacterium]